jgi:two-component system sensor histidine kinase CpxA
MLWFFLNLVLLGVVLLFVFNLNVRSSPGSRFWANRFESMAPQITEETRGHDRVFRDTVLKRYSAAYGVEFYIFDSSGEQLGGQPVQLPPEVAADLARAGGPPRDMPGPGRPGPGPPRPGERNGPPRPPNFFRHTTSPNLYWSASPIFIVEGEDSFRRGLLLVASDSFTGHGLFFDPTPWLIIAGVVIVVSILFWFPLLRGITRNVAQMTDATEAIANEQFEVRVNQTRSDELGRLGAAINQLAHRLSGFVHGQKRFLGDISHELNSPLARMQFALDLLELKSGEASRSYVNDVREEIELMSRLVAELIDYSRAGIKGARIETESIPLRPLVEEVAEREAKSPSLFTVDVEGGVEVLAQRELLGRALGNVIRNALRHGGEGQVVVSAVARNGQMLVTVTDEGPGVPEGDLDRLFDPFFRVDDARTRESGGSGLGLAIVRSCVEACGGTVTAANRQPTGFGVTITLDRADGNGK